MEGVEFIDYKSVSRLQKFMDSKGKILPRRQTGNCARHQRQLAVAIKRARIMGLLPFVNY
jgi:small subunit ribosomal protein S18